MPQTPAASVDFKRLLSARERLLHFAHSMVAISNVAPRICVTRVDIDRYAEHKDGFLPLFKFHMGTTTSELLFGVKHIDLERSLEALDSLNEAILEEVITGQTTHCPGTFLIRVLPSFTVASYISLDVALHAEGVCIS